MPMSTWAAWGSHTTVAPVQNLAIWFGGNPTCADGVKMWYDEVSLYDASHTNVRSAQCSTAAWVCNTKLCSKA